MKDSRWSELGPGNNLTGFHNIEHELLLKHTVLYSYFYWLLYIESSFWQAFFSLKLQHTLACMLLINFPMRKKMLFFGISGEMAGGRNWEMQLVKDARTNFLARTFVGATNDDWSSRAHVGAYCISISSGITAYCTNIYISFFFKILKNLLISCIDVLASLLCFAWYMISIILNGFYRVLVKNY